MCEEYSPIEYPSTHDILSRKRSYCTKIGIAALNLTVVGYILSIVLIFIITFVAMALCYMLGFGSAAVDEVIQSLSTGPISMVLSSAIEYAVIGLLMYIPISSMPKVKTQCAEYIPAKTIIWRWFACYGIGEALAIILSFTFSLIGKWTGIGGGMESSTEVILNMDMGTQMFFGIIVAPVMEELLLRGVFLSRARNLGDRFAIITSAILFGLYHGNVEQCVYAFFIGLFLADIVIKTGKLSYAIAFHMAFNAVSIIGASANGIWGEILILVVMAIGLITAMFNLNILKAEAASLMRRPAGEPSAISFSGFWIATLVFGGIICIGVTIMSM